MSNEITLYASLRAEKDNTRVEVCIETLQIDWATTTLTHQRVSIGTSEQAIDLGGATAGGMFVAINRDATNFISLRPASGETNMAKLSPGEFAFFRLSPDATAPYAIADTASCNLEYWVLSA
jgi:hypothetical protein